MPRPPRLAIAGATYHITAGGNNGEPIFADDADRNAYLTRLVKMVHVMQIRILAYVLMSNHIHLVLQTTTPNISAGLHRLQGPYAAYYNRRHGRTDHVFGKRFQSGLVEDDIYLLALTRYIHRNPVRAGLVRQPEDYPWSSFRSYTDPGADQSVVNPRPVLELISADLSTSRRAYARFVRDDGHVAPATTASASISTRISG